MTQTDKPRHLRPSTAPPEDLTKRQHAILEYIQKRVAKHGFPPSIREIGVAVSLSSPSTVKHHLDALERAGFIVRTPGQARSLELVATAANPHGTKDSESLTGTQPSCMDEDPRPYQPMPTQPMTEMIPIPVAISEEDGVSIPLLGQIAAGTPITAEEYIEDTFTLPTSLTGHGQLFMLRVNGDSMIDAGILDGDYVVIRSQANANDGQFVAAMIDDEATVKELSHDNSHVWLLPHNDMYEPIMGDEAAILGIVVTVIRAI